MENDSIKKTLVKNVLRNVAIILGVGIVYYFFIKFSPITPVCPFRKITGFLCPICGISHMCVSILHGHFADAFQANQLLFTTWPLIAAQLIYNSYLNISKKERPVWNRVLVYIYCAAAVVFTVVRNVLLFK